jgi:hypothetical protein
MEPLDLSAQKPRGGRAELAGVTFLPRSIDKMRGLMPGGVADGYTVEGFTAAMLEKLGISVEAFAGAVASAKDDADVATFVTEHAVAGGIDTWNGLVLNRLLYNGNREEAIAENPWLADHREITHSLDFLQYREDHGLDND